MMFCHHRLRILLCHMTDYTVTNQVFWPMEGSKSSTVQQALSIRNGSENEAHLYLLK